MSTKGQTINDRLNAAKYTLAGQALARCICKASTEELKRPKKKHLDYLTATTYEINVSMMQLANLLIDRTNHSNWAVVYKSLITVHHLMSYGSERFTQYLASSNYSFQQLNKSLHNITIPNEHIMLTFIKRYSDYINQKALSYRQLAVDLCRIQRGEDNILRTMPIERLLETLPIIQKQLDVLLDFGCTANDLNNSIIIASFTLLFHDSIRLFASYNDGIINLFEKYFDLNKKMCREAFEAYKKFLNCTDRVAEFLKIGDSINLDRGEIPDFKRAPSSLLDAFESHLKVLEGGNKKRGDINDNTNGGNNKNNNNNNNFVIDTKLAAFPSFSATASLDFSPSPMAQIASEFELFGLDDPFQSGKGTAETAEAATTTTTAPTNTVSGKEWAADPKVAKIPSTQQSAASDAILFTNLFTKTNQSVSPALPRAETAQELVTGYTAVPSPDPTLTLKPTATTTAIATITGVGQTPWPTILPSTTAVTSTPLLGNINWSTTRPNAPQLGSVNWSSSSTSNSSFQSSSTNWSSSIRSNNTSQGSAGTGGVTGAGGSIKAKHESIFEDLEKTMRQSLATSK